MNSMMLLAFFANFLVIMTKILVYAIIFRIVVSWFRMGQPYGPKSWIERLLEDVTNPILNVVKKVPHKIGMIDLSPMIAIFGLEIFTYLVINALNNLL